MARSPLQLNYVTMLEITFKGIFFEYVQNAEILKHSRSQNKRFSNSSTVTGTRSHHCFIPTLNGKMNIGRISTDISNNLYTTVTVNAHRESPVLQFPIMGGYVSAIYDRKWYIGLVIDISMAEMDCEINFMVTTSSTDKHTFHWPVRNDKCWVPFQHILCQINPPVKMSYERYLISPSDLSKIEYQYDALLSNI